MGYTAKAHTACHPVLSEPFRESSNDSGLPICCGSHEIASHCHPQLPQLTGSLPLRDNLRRRTRAFRVMALLVGQRSAITFFKTNPSQPDARRKE